MALFNGLTGLQGLTRRKFLQTAALTGAAAGMGVPKLANAAQAVPPGKKLFNDIELSYFQDSNWLHAPMWLSPLLQKEAGVGIKGREMYDGGDAVAKILPQLLSRKPRFDWVQYPSLFFGAFAETGMLEPLDDYFAQYEGSQAYLDWVMPAYREFYTKWSDKTYGVMLDGDIHILHYRNSFFQRADLRTKFSKRFQRDLDVPATWLDFLDATQFFTEELKGDGIYGTSMVVNPPNFGWGFWMDIAASAGVNYFDENMNPVINQGKAAESLDIFREIVKFGPPGAESMDIGTTIQRWQSGSDVMSVWWIDLAEFTVQQQPRTSAAPSFRAGRTTTVRSPTGRSRCGAAPPRSPRTFPRMSRMRPSTSFTACPIQTTPTTSSRTSTAGPTPSVSPTTAMRRQSSTWRPIPSGAPATSGPPTRASSRTLTRPRTTWMPAWPTSRWAIPSSSGKVRRNMPMPWAATCPGRSRASSPASRPWTRRPKNG
jgi:ABC-type glycerol-3-phosphate transport system substrate-binding protein